MAKGPAVFVTDTPVPGYPTVTLYEHSWSFHIEHEHPEVKGQVGAVQSIVADPTYVIRLGADANRNVIFLNEQYVNEVGSPLFVAVSSSELVVRSVYYKDAWTNFNPSRIKAESIIWKKTP